MRCSLRDAKVFEPIKPRLARRNDVDVAIVVHILDGHLQPCPGGTTRKIFESIPLLGICRSVRRRVTSVDDGLHPFRRLAIEAVDEDARMGGGSGFTRVGIDSFSRDELLFAIAIEVGQMECMNL